MWPFYTGFTGQVDGRPGARKAQDDREEIDGELAVIVFEIPSFLCSNFQRAITQKKKK